MLAAASRLACAALATFAALGLPGPAQAVTVVPEFYFNDPMTDRADFEAAAGMLTLESFEADFSTGVSVSFPQEGSQELVVTAGRDLSRSTFLRGVTDGDASLGVAESSVTVTFTFNRPITAFGIDVNDMNFISLSFADDLGNMMSDVLMGDQGGPAGGPSWENLQFFGVTNSEAFSSVQLTFSAPTNSGNAYFDRLQFSTIPEPSTALLLAAALAGLAAQRRQRS